MKAPLFARPLTNVHLEQIADQFAMSDLTLPFWGCRKKMPMRLIVRLEGEGNYTVFHFSDGSQLMVSLTLKKMESRLSPRVFVRPHKKSIINLLYLESVNPDRQQMSVSLVNGDRIEVSRRKASRFIKQVRGFQQELMDIDAKPTAPIVVVA
ncbi:LytR/AlgR family response regulator transcription factor [Spirosoma validum]|uniref:LytTR family transcriptional regulator n=1 Tax=Spirosoma validum TaxID=2771355 RepID=A0A927B387_9BACT|nr:LytTR family DNA-binding domain-containing protein [Spirosoma validum]MBD2754518.1 LytTR family transcriptional regulator [Spirosoma validum]